LQAAGATWEDVVAMTTYHVGFQDQVEAFVEINLVAESPPGD
jgi:hypothetical protein